MITERNINIKDKDGNTLLMRLLKKGKIKEVKKLLKRKGLDINIKNNKGESPLIYSLVDTYTCGNEISKILIEQDDIDINIGDKDGNTPLMRYIGFRNYDMIKVLLDRNDIDINITTKRGVTALSYAISVNYIEVIKLLLKHDDINVNIKDIYGDTPFKKINRLSKTQICDKDKDKIIQLIKKRMILF